MNLDTELKPSTKIHPKCITDLNMKCKTVELLEHNPGENLGGRDFLGTKPKYNP